MTTLEIISNLLLGASVLPLLIMCNLIIIQLCLTFPKHILGLSGVMIGLDAICTIGYTFTVDAFCSNMELMVGGVGIAIFTALFHKVKTMTRVLGNAFSHEIGN